MQWLPRRTEQSGDVGVRRGDEGRRRHVSLLSPRFHSLLSPRFRSLLSPNIHITITRSPMRAAGVSFARSPLGVAGISTRKTIMTTAERKTAVAALAREAKSLLAVVTIASAASAAFHLLATRKAK